MKTTVFTKRTICVLAVLLAASLGRVTTQAADREPAMVAPGSDATTETDISAGAAEDTLGACIARIPKDASIGQVMIAEQSCWRDENDRKPIQAVPGARSTRLIAPEHGSAAKSDARASMVASE